MCIIDIDIVIGITSSIITRNLADFKKHLYLFIGAMLPVSKYSTGFNPCDAPIAQLASVNTLLKYGLKELGLRFRTRLTHYLYKRYLTFACPY